MRASSSLAYMCTIPPPIIPVTPPPLSEAELAAERARVLARGLELIEPLKSRCLYHTLEWFTYSFCHGQEVRQFHALPYSTTDDRVPAADPKYDAYTLGRFSPEVEKPATSREGRPDVETIGEEEQTTGGVELMDVIRFGGGQEQRYLAQRWTDGTRCDISNEPRTVEVQVSSLRRMPVHALSTHAFCLTMSLTFWLSARNLSSTALDNRATG